MKKNAGFTLVELIVVIAILAILAGVAIPVYSGYISKANEAADLTALDAIKTAVVFAETDAAVKQNPPAGFTLTSLKVEAGTLTVNGAAVTDTNMIKAITNLMGAESSTWSFTFKSTNTKAEWNGNAWTLS